MDDLLLLVHRMPYPPTKGDKVRSYHLLKYLAMRHRVHLATFIDDVDDVRHIDVVRALCGETYFARLRPLRARVRSLGGLVRGDALAIPYYRDGGMLHWVHDLIARMSIRRAVVFSSPMAQYVNDISTLERVIDFVDVDSAKWTQYANRERAWYRAPMRAIYRREGTKLLEFERRTARQSRASVFVTPEEAALFRTLAPECADRIVSVENGVDSVYFSPSNELNTPYAAGGPVLVFTGAMDYLPNVDAVIWFAREILPQIRSKRSDVRFCVVGARPTEAVRALAEINGVSVTGTVDDVRPYLKHAAVAVVPMRIARGIQNKALEAMAMGCPLVISAASAKALNATPGEAFCVATDTESFVRSILDILSNPERAARLASAARGVVVRNYSWNSNLERISACFRDIPGPARAGFAVDLVAEV